jgi:hypothetical protein
MASYRSHRRASPACVLTIVLVLCTAAWSAQFGGGSGTADDPYQIWTPEQMNAIGTDPNTWDKHFKLMADIDLSAYDGTSFNIIGTGSTQGKRQISIAASAGPFAGVFDGNDHAISNFHYACESAAYVGLFGYVDGPTAEIRNVRLLSPRMNAKSSACVGCLMGYLGRGRITNCRALDADVMGAGTVGGLVARSYYNCVIDECSSSGIVCGNGSCTGGLVGDNDGAVSRCCSSAMTFGGDYTGGLVGDNNGTIERCCSIAMVLGGDYIGGLVGGSSGAIADCYATGVAVGEQRVGGLVGANPTSGTVRRCYATGLVIGTAYTGGLVGYGSGYPYYPSIIASFWDIETSGQDRSTGGTGKPTALMQTVGTFLKAGWDFAGETTNGTEDVWWIAEGQDYPRLRWEAEPGQVFRPLEPSNLLKGTGTQDDPFLIYTAEELNLVGVFSAEWDKCFKLMADIDLRAYKGTDFNLIGQPGSGRPPYSVKVEGGFTGVFDGNGHTISNLTWSSDDANSVGLFRSVASDKAQIRDLGLISPHIGNGGSDCVGALVGYLGSGAVLNCYVQNGAVAGRNWIGGLVGCNYHGTIDRSFSTAMTVGEDYVGGLIGQTLYSISDCYATGVVIGHSCVGGLVGSDYKGSIAYCYSTGLVIGEEGMTGGLVACGPDNPITASFWDTLTSGQAFSDGGTGKTTAEMQTAGTFAAWCRCGTPAWTIDDGNDYPRLSWENKPGEPMRAVPEDGSPAGEGTEQHPYLIYTAQELRFIGNNPCYWAGHFLLMADIDLASREAPGFNPIGQIDRMLRSGGFEGRSFTGVFDGNGHAISGLRCSSAGKYGIGLFGYVDDLHAEIRNLKLVDPNVDPETSASYVGALVGYLGRGRITNCSVTRGFASGYQATGGLLGYCVDGTVASCHSTATVTGGLDTGGLVGHMDSGKVTKSSAAGLVKGNEDVGGLVGYLSGTVTDSYAAGSVTGVRYIGGQVGYSFGSIMNSYAVASAGGTSEVGGLAGTIAGGTVTNCYAAGIVTGTYEVGGLVRATVDVRTALPADWVTGCFWDIEATGQTASGAGTGKTTAEMKTAQTFRDAGWDLEGETPNGTEDIWWIIEGRYYPHLWWEESDGASQL